MDTALTLPLDAHERQYLRELLESDLSETRVEVRRTGTPDYHEGLQHREDLIRGLLEKLGAEE